MYVVGDHSSYIYEMLIRYYTILSNFVLPVRNNNWQKLILFLIAMLAYFLISFFIGIKIIPTIQLMTIWKLRL